MRAEAKMVEIPTCGVVKCGAWSIEAGGASKMRPSFLISHFSFPILDSRGSAPSGRLHNGNWGISVRHPIGVWVACLSTDRRARTSRTSIPRSRAGCTRLRTVGLSNCRVSDAELPPRLLTLFAEGRRKRKPLHHFPHRDLTQRLLSFNGL